MDKTSSTHVDTKIHHFGDIDGSKVKGKAVPVTGREGP
jgi:hypothetical protein